MIICVSTKNNFHELTRTQYNEKKRRSHVSEWGSRDILDNRDFLLNTINIAITMRFRITHEDLAQLITSVYLSWLRSNCCVWSRFTEVHMRLKDQSKTRKKGTTSEWRRSSYFCLELYKCFQILELHGFRRYLPSLEFFESFRP